MGVCCSRVRPDVAAVPPSERITAEWLTSALRSELPEGARVASLRVVDIAAKAEDGTELPNGGGLAGGARGTAHARAQPQHPRRERRCACGIRRLRCALLG